MANKASLGVVTALFWCVPGAAFGFALVLTGSLWVGIAAFVVGGLAARAGLRRSIPTLTNNRSVVAIENAVEGRIEAVEVFWRPGCPFTEGLGRTLADAGVPTNLHNIWESPDDAALLRSIAGGQETVPTLMIGSVALINPSARLVMATLRQHAPHLLQEKPH